MSRVGKCSKQPGLRLRSSVDSIGADVRSSEEVTEKILKEPPEYFWAEFVQKSPLIKKQLIEATAFSPWKAKRRPAVAVSLRDPTVTGAAVGGAEIQST
jgi:hypothetical protein